MEPTEPSIEIQDVSPKTSSELRVSAEMKRQTESPQSLASLWIEDSIADLRKSSEEANERATKPQPEGRFKSLMWRLGRSGRASEAQYAESLRNAATYREESLKSARETGDYSAIEKILAADASQSIRMAEVLTHGEDSSYLEAARSLDEGLVALSLLSGLNPESAAGIRNENIKIIERVDRKVEPINVMRTSTPGEIGNAIIDKFDVIGKLRR